MDEARMQERESRETPAAGPTRRRLLLGAGAAALGLTAAACSDGDGGSGDQDGGTDDGARRDGDVVRARTAAGLEVLAVTTYGALLDAGAAGLLGDLPEAVAELFATAQSHHQAHLEAWNARLTAEGEAEVSEPPAELAALTEQARRNATDVAGAVGVALGLEQVAAATYLDHLGRMEGEEGIELAATIQPIDMQHIAMLLFVTGEYPVPDDFASAEDALVD